MNRLIFPFSFFVCFFSIWYSVYPLILDVVIFTRDIFVCLGGVLLVHMHWFLLWSSFICNNLVISFGTQAHLAVVIFLCFIGDVYKKFLTSLNDCPPECFIFVCRNDPANSFQKYLVLLSCYSMNGSVVSAWVVIWTNASDKGSAASKQSWKLWILTKISGNWIGIWHLVSLVVD